MLAPPRGCLNHHVACRAATLPRSLTLWFGQGASRAAWPLLSGQLRTSASAAHRPRRSSDAAPCREAPQAPGWPRERGWPAPPPHQLRQVRRDGNLGRAEALACSRASRSGVWKCLEHGDPATRRNVLKFGTGVFRAGKRMDLASKASAETRRRLPPLQGTTRGTSGRSV